MTLSPFLLDVLVCPACKGQLQYSEADSELTCAVCRVAYPVRDGIPIMLEDEARPLGR